MTVVRAIRTVAPAVPVLTVQEVYDHLRIDESPEEKSYIEGLIATATDHIEGVGGIIGKALITQTWKVLADTWPECLFPLPLAPVQSITSIKYWDAQGAQQTLAASGYWSLYSNETDPYVGWQSGVSLPGVYTRADAIEIVFVAGYGDTADDVPAGIKHAMKLLIGQWYESREATGEPASDISFGVTQLLAPKRAIFV
jgi:uncharacterized phiE125 gp8 family phage protein